MKASRATSDSGSRSHPSLPYDVLESIFRRLPPRDLVRTKALSSYWNSFAESDRFIKTPWFVLPKKGSSCYMYIEENTACSLHQKTSDLFLDEFTCIGSSHGWLIFLSIITLTPVLLNPYTGVRIDQIPSLKAVFRIYSIEKSDQAGELVLYRKIGGKEWKIQQFTEILLFCNIQKAILSAEPVGNYSLVLLCWKKVVYYRNGDASWTKVNGANQEESKYLDIICHENKLYALHNTGSICTWDLRSWEAGERMAAALPSQSIKRKADLAGLSSGWWLLGCYLVESGGEILLVVRFTFAGMEILFDINCGTFHMTRLFQVFKLDLEEKKWVEVNSLGDRSLFVGGNHSISIPAKNLVSCKGNSIYFTDEYSPKYLMSRGGNLSIFREDLIPLPYLGGHDNGVYSLENGCCSAVYKFKWEEVMPPPWWIVPTSCKLNA